MYFCDAARFVSNLNEGSMFSLFCMLAWAMWNNRNEWIHGKIRKSPKNLLAEAASYLEVFDLVHSCGVSSLPGHVHGNLLSQGG